MKKYNRENERIKRQYLIFLKEAKGQSEATIDAVAKSLNRFEEHTKFWDFKYFHFEQARAFKRKLSEQNARRSREKLSKSTLHSTLNHLKSFFQWLSMQQGYKSKIQYSDAEYFNMSEKDTRIAKARRQKSIPTMEQIKHVNLVESYVDQDAREVKTKFSKSFRTYFFSVGEEMLEIVTDWITFLLQDKLWCNDNPLFPSTFIANVLINSLGQWAWIGKTGGQQRPFAGYS